MGRVQTVGYWEKLIVPKLTIAQLNDFSHDVRLVLVHPEVGLLKPGVVENTDVLIAEQFAGTLASSVYAWVIYVTASASNPDFTDKWRTIPLSPDPENKEQKAELARFKVVLGRVAREILLEKWFPEAIGVEYGLNFWPIRVDGAFVVVPTS